MNTTGQILRKENTDRLVARAAQLGYLIGSIDLELGTIDILDARTHDYTPEVRQDFQGTWTIHTTTYGAKNIEEIEKVTEGYQRAIALVRELEACKLEYLTDYRATC